MPLLYYKKTNTASVWQLPEIAREWGKVSFVAVPPFIHTRALQWRYVSFLSGVNELVLAALTSAVIRWWCSTVFYGVTPLGAGGGAGLLQHHRSALSDLSPSSSSSSYSSSSSTSAAASSSSRRCPVTWLLLQHPPGSLHRGAKAHWLRRTYSLLFLFLWLNLSFIACVLQDVGITLAF